MTTTETRPALETGWEPSTPVTDTLLRRFVLNHADYIDAVVSAGDGRCQRSAAFAAADLRRPAALFNSAILLRPLAYHDQQRVLDDIESFFATGRGEVLLWSPWPTHDLTGRGWRLMGHPPLLVRPPTLPLPIVRPVRVERVADASALARWSRIVVDGFPFPDVPDAGALIGPGLLDDDRFTGWLAYDGAEPVTAAALFSTQGVAQFVFGVTRPDARRTGHWAALVRERLVSAGGLPAAGLFNDNSRPGAERFGFWPITRFTVWSRPRD
jgi:hypothetical protein